MKNDNQSTISLYNNVPKILLGLIKPFFILIMASVLFLNPRFENYYFNITMIVIWVMILATCVYHFFQTLRILIQYKKNYLIIDNNGLTLNSTLSPDLHVQWRDIKAIHPIIKFDKFVLETGLVKFINRINKYEIMYPIKSINADNSTFCDIVVNAKYLSIHIKELEHILLSHIPEKSKQEEPNA